MNCLNGELIFWDIVIDVYILCGDNPIYDHTARKKVVHFINLDRQYILFDIDDATQVTDRVNAIVPI
jgi:hypothetical protein